MSAQVILRGFGKKSGSGTGAILTVNGVPGDNISITNGEKTYTGVFSNEGTAIFKGLSTDTWTATMSNESQSVSRNININVEANLNLTYTKIYGISRVITNSSPQWARTDEAVGMNATASAGTVPGSSDFDNCYPWNEIQRVIMPTGDIMVKIPKFWYKRYRATINNDEIEYIKIATGPAEGFSLHPAFYHSNIEKDCFYIGAYEGSIEDINGTENIASLSGRVPWMTKDLSQMRTISQNKGQGWGIMDIFCFSAIQLLILVEFSDNNVQTKIGKGNCDSGAHDWINTGSCDNVPNLTGYPTGTNGKTGVIWRGIENIWGNIVQVIDGIFNIGPNNYLCYNPVQYSNHDFYILMPSTFGGVVSGYVVEEICSNSCPFLMLPSETSGGSMTTYYCDYSYKTSATDGTTKRTLWLGGRVSQKENVGLFTITLENMNYFSSEFTGSRLMYIPQEEE